MRANPKGRGSRTAARGALIVAAALLAIAPIAASAQILSFDNLSFNEMKLGVLKHDARFLGGKEPGVDINPEIILASPVADAWAASLPGYIRWMVQPRPTLGFEINTAGATNQAYFGVTWTWQLLSNAFLPGDGITAGIFFGPGFNDGARVTTRPDRKSLGSPVLFREALEIGYRITPVYQVSGFIDHVSNAGFARYNQSINDVGVRFGVRF